MQEEVSQITKKGGIALDTTDVTRFPSAITVTELNTFIKLLIDQTMPLNDLYIKGEISNFKNHVSSGHYYFSLKDKESQIRAVMFRSSAAKLPFIPENGMMVVAHGRISAFVRDGQYQLYADSMEPDGVGALYIAFEQLKNKLAAEGLFAPERKRPLPKIPRAIGVITSPTGAAVRDIINISTRRFPFAKIIVYPALVQGESAAQSLVRGVEYFNNTSSADVIIIGRGGGSIEDLWAFNNEQLARVVAASQIPVISAVGHETDFTICDFAADLRAPTPSAAAELAVPDTEELKHKISNIISRESAVIRQAIAARRESLSRYSKARVLSNPQYVVDDRRMLSGLLAQRLEKAYASIAGEKHLSLAALSGKLEALSPLSILSRGYSAVYSAEGDIVKNAEDVSLGDNITMRMNDGEIKASVTEVCLNDTKETK